MHSPARERLWPAAGAILTIDLGAIRANWRWLRDHVAPAACGAVLKADAYGLGAALVGPALLAEGCRDFFVAHLEEGIALRQDLRGLPGAEAARIHVMHGLFDGTEREALAHGLIPVLNSLEQSAGWAALSRAEGRRLPAWIQLDTGMARFGFSAGELDRLVEDGRDLAAVEPIRVMSHLACADEPEHPANAAQLGAFDAMRRHLPHLPTSLAASSGIFLDRAWHGDLVRPGVALHGVAPLPRGENPLRPVLRLDARVVQTRSVPAGTAVGYGHTFTTQAPSRLATIAVGYADGFLRSASNRGRAMWHGVALPILGRVSMDSIVLDASALPENALRPGDTVELIGPDHDLEAVAEAAGTIPYEILTSLGQRYHRRYETGAPGSSGEVLQPTGPAVTA